MNKYHYRKMYLLVFFSLGIATIAALILYALSQNINVFMTPSEISERKFAHNQAIRLGGMVKPRSVVRSKESLVVKFTVTDFQHEVQVSYEGSLPDLFREGKGVVAEGYLNPQGVFMAHTILAKHDENYTPQKIQHKLAQGTN